jgi:PAS domain S-box-containing protein
MLKYQVDKFLEEHPELAPYLDQLLSEVDRTYAKFDKDKIRLQKELKQRMGDEDSDLQADEATGEKREKAAKPRNGGEDQFFRHIVETTTEPIAVFSENGGLFLTNNALDTLLGVDTESSEISNLTAYFSRESRQVYNANIISALEQGGTWEGILQMNSSFGESFPAWFRADAVLDDEGRILFIIALMHDASGQDLVERTLSSLQASGHSLDVQEDPYIALQQIADEIGKQSALLHCILDVAWLKDKEGKYSKVNKVFSRWFGRSESDVIGKTDIDLFDAESARLMIATDKEVLRTKRLIRKEIPVTGPDGRLYWCETIKVPSFNERREITGVAGIMRDISLSKGGKPKSSEHQTESVADFLNRVEHKTEKQESIPETPTPVVESEKQSKSGIPDLGQAVPVKYELHQRDAIMAAITLAAEYFLRVPPWEKHIQEVLEWLGRATNVSRVCLFQNSKSVDGNNNATLRYEWVTVGISANINNEHINQFDYDAIGLRRWSENMKSGDSIMGNVSGFPESEQTLFQGLETRSIVAMPIFVDGAWWGYLSFEESIVEREWKPIINDVLKTAANLIGAVIERERTEGSYRSMVEQSLQELLIAQDGRIVFANDEAIRNSGFTEQELYRFGSTDLFVNVIDEDQGKVSQALASLKSGSVQNVRIEYQSQKKDGSRRWIESLISMVSYKGEPAIQIVQVDISERKHIESVLRDRSSLERLIGNISAHFINLSYSDIDAAIVESLRMLGSFFSADRCYLFLVDRETSSGIVSHQWHIDSLQDTTLENGAIDTSELHWMGEQFSTGAAVHIDDVEKIPAEGAAEQQILRKLGMASLALVPVVVNERTIGNIALAYSQPTSAWQEETVPALTLAAETIVNALNRKNAEESLIKTREMYRLATEAGKVGVWDWDLENNSIYIDPTLKEMLGYSDDEIKNDIEEWIQLVHPEDYPVVSSRIQQIHKEKIETYQSEQRMIHKDGRVLWFLVRGLVIRDVAGAPIRIIGTDTNVSELKQAEEALKESEGWNRAILNSLPDTVYLIDQDGVYVDVLAAGDSANTSGRATFVGDSIYDELNSHHARAIAERIGTVIANGSVEIVEYEVFHAESNTTKFYESRISKVSSETVLSLTRDITERKSAELALLKSNETLKIRNDELDAFSHTVAHDLKNPLTLVIGYAGLLNEAAGDMKPAEVKQYLSNILLNSKRMNSIIESLLLLAEVRQEDVALDALDMKFVVDESLSRLNYMIQEYMAVIVMPDEWPACIGYSSWVEEVWVNYITNAMKYGGRPPRIELGADLSMDGYVRYWVKDNGKGILKEDIEKLFSPLTRLGAGTIKGYGLGLSIAKRIVEKLNGKIGVESLAGQGSKFWFALPIDSTNTDKQ